MQDAPVSVENQPPQATPGSQLPATTMAHIIPRKAVASGSQSPEPQPDSLASSEASIAPIKRKPVEGISVSHNRVSSLSAGNTPQTAGFTVRTDEPVELRFALGPMGLAAWYDPTCNSQPGNSAPAWSAHGMLKKLQIGHDELKTALEDNVQNIQLLETSPGGLTCLLYRDLEGSQQQHCEMPFKSPMTLLGPGKHQYQKCEEAHGNILPWVTTCTVNGVPLEDIQISFGPDDAYFAYEAVKRKVQSKLIIDLQDCVNTRPNELPSHLSMGIDGAWSILWADGSHQHHIMPSQFPTLCALMERPELPRLKKVILSPSKRDEFIIEYENGHYFIRARLQREDIARLDAYLKRLNGSSKVIILGIDSRPLKGDYICRPFVLPVSDFASTPYGELAREGHLAEWREHHNIHELTNMVSEISKDAGACTIM